MQVSNIERSRAMRRKHFKFIQLKWKMKKKYHYVMELEGALSKVSSKAITVAKFQEYLRARFAAQVLKIQYYINLYRKNYMIITLNYFFECIDGSLTRNAKNLNIIL